MATVTRGPYKGKGVQLHQWANDWFSVNGVPPQDSIFNPTSLQLTPAEARSWRMRPNGMEREYVLLDNGRFRRRKLEVVR